VFVSIRTPVLAAGALGDEQPVANPATTEIVVTSAAARRCGRRALPLGVGPCNVQHDLELEQL
jgi:hypothetical protein